MSKQRGKKFAVGWGPLGGGGPLPMVQPAQWLIRLCTQLQTWDVTEDLLSSY